MGWAEDLHEISCEGGASLNAAMRDPGMGVILHPVWAAHQHKLKIGVPRYPMVQGMAGKGLIGKTGITIAGRREAIHFGVRHDCLCL